MKIKKMYQGNLPDNKIVNGYSTSQTDTYSCSYLNSRLSGYPIGAIYISALSTSPASLFGGTWQQLQSRYLYATGNSQNTGAAVGKDNMSTDTGTTTANTSITHYHGLGSGYADIGIGWTSSWSNFLRERSHGGGYTATFRMNRLPGYDGVSEFRRKQ